MVINRLTIHQFGGTKITVSEEEYSIFRDAEFVPGSTQTIGHC
jgi:hypothetical protein